MANIRFERNTLWVEDERALDVLTITQRANALRAEMAASAMRTAVAALKRAAVALWRRYEAWRREQAAVGELMALDERMLKDIGLSRTEIRTAVAHGRYGEPEIANENVAVKPAANGNTPRHVA
jgi:uncharacterized protein YjiS (DUF1127 family)